MTSAWSCQFNCLSNRCTRTKQATGTFLPFVLLILQMPFFFFLNIFVIISMLDDSYCLAAVGFCSIQVTVCTHVWSEWQKDCAHDATTMNWSSTEVRSMSFWWIPVFWNMDVDTLHWSPLQQIYTIRTPLWWATHSVLQNLPLCSTLVVLINNQKCFVHENVMLCWSWSLTFWIWNTNFSPHLSF